MAYRLQERAASVGFDWPDVGGPLNKVREELAEVERAEELCRSARPDPNPDARGARRRDRRPALCGRQSRAQGGRSAGARAGPDQREVPRAVRGGGADGAERRGSRCTTAGLEVLDGLWDEVKRETLAVDATGEKIAPEDHDHGGYGIQAGESAAETRSPRECAGCRRSRRPCARDRARSRSARRCRTSGGRDTSHTPRGSALLPGCGASSLS